MSNLTIPPQSDDLTVIQRYFSPECSEEDIQQYYIRWTNNPDFQDKSDAYLSLQRVIPLFTTLEENRTASIVLEDEPAANMTAVFGGYRKWILSIAALLVPILVALFLYKHQKNQVIESSVQKPNMAYQNTENPLQVNPQLHDSSSLNEKPIPLPKNKQNISPKITRLSGLTALDLRSNQLSGNDSLFLSFPVYTPHDKNIAQLAILAKNCYSNLRNPEKTDNLASSTDMEVEEADQNIYKALADNDTSAAINLCAEKLRHTPMVRAFDPFLQHGRRWFESGQYQSAYQLFDIYLRYEPDSLLNKRFKAKIYFQMFIFCVSDWKHLEQYAYPIFLKIDKDALPENQRKDFETLYRKMKLYNLWNMD
jgi:hypothetical protein